MTGRPGRNAAAKISLVVHERLAERTGSCRVPEPGRFGSAECEHHGGVAAKDGSVDHVGVFHGLTDGAAGVAVPDLAVPSKLPVRIRSPSGLNSTLQT